MSENEPRTQRDLDRTGDGVATCPGCGEPVDEIEPIGPITYLLQPCGHQVDAQVYDDYLD